MTDFDRFRKLNQLKEIERMTQVRGRNESPAEHTWACLMYAEYFFKILSVPLDAEKVRKLLLYHDVVEIEAGDVPEIDTEARMDKDGKEFKAFQNLRKKLPVEMRVEYEECFEEFEAHETPEAKFALAIDKLEPMIHQLDHKPDWRKYGYTEKLLWEIKGRHMQAFPKLLEFYNDLIVYLKENDYIDEE